MNYQKNLFSGKAQDYVKYRPSYPDHILDVVIEHCGVDSTARIADIGSGTGKFSELLTRRGFNVTGVEPNDEMRTASETLLKESNLFSAIDGYAEKTHIPSQSIDLITAAQAFHWFKGAETKEEFRRILKDAGYVALLWNQRDTQKTLQRELNAILDQYTPTHRQQAHGDINDQDIHQFFAPEAVRAWEMTYTQQFTKSNFIGRINSASYCPQVGTPEYNVLETELIKLHSKHSAGGLVNFPYKTRLFIAKLGGNS